MIGNWQKIHQRIIKRQVPHAILSWRYLLPKQNRMVHLHRKTFLSAWADYPRILWCLIALYSYTTWYLYYAWRQVYLTWKNRSKVLFNEQGISPWQQLKNLTALALLHSIPPHFYYQYQLHRFPEREWLNFIYTHELPHWHHMMSPNICARSQHLMSHKHDFSLEMKRLGLPTIPSVLHVKRGRITEQQLFNRQSLFLKPECGSRKEGCYALSYHAETEQYRLQGDNVDEGLTQVQIQAIIGQVASKQHYLIQPLLENHPLITDRCQCDELVTLRLITKLNEGKPKIVSAILEVPVMASFNQIIPIGIELETGTLLDMSEQYLYLDKDAQQLISLLANFNLPLWPDVVSIAEQAHCHFTDINSIGWDLAITPLGVKLIEGNINWGVAPHQLIGYIPLSIN